jgi:hypothetical protein
MPNAHGSVLGSPSCHLAIALLVTGNDAVALLLRSVDRDRDVNVL